MGSYEKRPWYGFVDIHLKAEDKVEVKKLSHDPQQFFKYMETAVAGGVKINVSYETRYKCYLSVMFGNFHEDNGGYAISTRGRTPEAAIAGNLYKHLVVCQSGKWKGQMGFDLME